MSDRITVKPVEGRAVRDPISLVLLPDEGAEVPNDQFWQRRLRDGDVEIVEPPPPPPPARREA